MSKKILITTMLLLGLILAGCQQQNQPAQEDQAAPALANPASVYCQGQGFTEEARQNDAGSYGVCIFKDGTECDTWDFLAGRCGQQNSFCAQHGFTLEDNGTNIATCNFKDGSTCDELAYFKGECQPGDNLP